MSSDLKVTNIKHESSASNNLVLASDGNVSITNAITSGTFNGTIGTSASGFGLITGVDTWRLTADKTSTAAITSDLERVSSDNAEYGSIGTAMTESSGVFSFPSTGIWMVQVFSSGMSSGGAVLYMGIQLMYTSDGTNFNVRARTLGGSSQTNYWNQGSTSAIFDITNTSTCKVRFDSFVSGSGAGVKGSTNSNHTHFNFIRLGDT